MARTFADPKEWLVEITPAIQSQLWEQSQRYGNPSSRWRAYINQICLYGFLNWVETEYALQASAWYSSPYIPAFWEFVNGTAVLLNYRRVILIPTEAIDDSELEVPQEWVDIPSWAGDFYLVVQVKPDGEWVRFWGYTTHQELKTLANYDPVDRTYCIDEINLTKDLNAFWMAYQFCTNEEIRTFVPPLPELSTTQAENMQQRLGTPSVIFPRLAVPFSMWGALLENEQWRQELYQKRQHPQEMESSQAVNQVINLSAWLQGIYEASWQAIETFLESNTSNLAFNFRSTTSSSATSIKRAKVIDLGLQAESQKLKSQKLEPQKLEPQKLEPQKLKSQKLEPQKLEPQKLEPQKLESQKLIILVALMPGANQQIGIRVQLHPIDHECLPDNIKLVLLSELGEIIQEVQAKVEDNYVQLKLFEGEVGERFNLQITLNSYQVTESFVI